MKKGIILLVILFLLTGCSKDKVATISNDTKNVSEATVTATVDPVTTDKAGTSAEGFCFEYNGVTIRMNTEVAPIIEALGDPVEYFEAPSCAFQGLDKIYYYNGFELSTYPLEEKDFVSTVNFLDDSVTTEKGIYLGASLEEVIGEYGDDYTQDLGSFTYNLGETKLTFIVEEEIVTSITYFAVVEGLNN